MVYCPLCKQESPLYFQSKDYNRNISPERFNHYRCPQCKLIFISPIPTNLSDYYSETYHFVPDSLEYLKVGCEPELYKIDIVQRFSKKGRLLEIGPSYGSFTYLAKNAGFEVDAIEMDKQCCQFLNEVVGVNAINSSDPVQVLKQAECYDVITLWHVLEHMTDPWAMLNTIYAKLKPDGIVVLAAPNPDAFQFHIMGRYWPHVDAPRHLSLIPMKLLAEKLEILGMKAELMTTTDKGSNGWNEFSWTFYISNFISSNRVKSKIRHYRVGRMLSFLLRPIEKIEGRGCAYTLVFRKGV